jgi:hypothetical protein
MEEMVKDAPRPVVQRVEVLDKKESARPSHPCQPIKSFMSSGLPYSKTSRDRSRRRS